MTDPRLKALEKAFLDHACAFETKEQTYKRAIREMDKEAWRDVKTSPAPKNEHVLVFAKTPDPEEIPIISCGCYFEEFKEWLVIGLYQKGLEVTHWQPLPPDPIQSPAQRIKQPNSF